MQLYKYSNEAIKLTAGAVISYYYLVLVILLLELRDATRPFLLGHRITDGSSVRAFGAVSNQI